MSEPSLSGEEFDRRNRRRLWREFFEDVYPQMVVVVVIWVGALILVKVSGDTAANAYATGVFVGIAVTVWVRVQECRVARKRLAGGS